MPTVSVVMSVFNGEAFLAEAVDSILTQTFEDFEFIIIDDGSTDKTGEILSRYAKSDQRVRVFSQENIGRAQSLNRGIALARASLIARMDADDISLPHRLQEQVEFMKGHADVGLLGADVQLIARDSRNLGPWFPLPTGDAEIRLELARSCPLIHPTVVMRKETALAVGGYRKALLDADDYDMFLRMAERTQVANLPRTLLLYRVHGNQASMRNIAQQAQCCLAARVAAQARIQGFPDPLIEVAEVRPQVLRSLGISAEEIRREEIAFFEYRMRFLPGADPEGALQAIGRFVDLCGSTLAEESSAANALMYAASICYRRGRLARALVFAGRAAVKQPAMAGRHIRMAVARRVWGVAERSA